MSTYEYRATDGDELTIRGNDDHVYVLTHDLEDGVIAQVAVLNEDAPAMALAILEAALVDEHSAPELYAAHFDLRRHVEKEAKQAEREAENANVRAWLQAVYPNTAAAHPDVELAEHMRQKYQQNRDYFLKIAAEIVPAEIAAPRIVQCGDPEPDRDAKWRDAEGDVWRWNETGWSCRSYRHGWGDIGYHVFPWTEVL